MKEQINEYLTLLAYTLAGISGAIGGCGAASIHILRDEHKLAMRAAYVLSYAIIGMISGIMFAAYGLAFRPEVHAISQVVPGAMLSGLGISLALAGTNVSTKWVLRRLGIEVELTMRRTVNPTDEHNGRIN